MKQFTIVFLCWFVFCELLNAQQIVPRTYDASRNPGFTTAQYESWTFNKPSNGPKFPFRLLKPKNWDSISVEKYPLIIFFHGKGEAGTDNNYQLVHGGKKHQDAVNMVGGVTFPGFVVFPQSNQVAWASGTSPLPDLIMAFELVDSLKIKYNINPNKIYVHGLSGGGLATWAALYHRPDLFAAALPMSAPGNDTKASFICPIPIWLSQGGVDNNPVPFVSKKMMAALRTAGAVDSLVTKYTEYPGQGHNIWNNTYNNVDFFPYMLRQDKRNIMLLGKNNICLGDKIDLGISPGFVKYRWYFNSDTIAGATANRIYNISIAGLYTAAFKRAPNSAWIYTNTVNINTALASAKPTIVGNNSFYLPSPSGNTVSLIGPENQIVYKWSSGATTAKVNVNGSGNYTLKVTPRVGCPSLISDITKVRVGPNGANPPFAPTELSAYPVSNSGIIVKWKDNASNEEHYEVYAGTQKGEPYAFVGVTNANAISFIVNNSAPSTTYFYKVRAVNSDGGNLSESETRAKTMGDFVVPTSPSNLQFAGFTPQAIQLTWKASFDSSGIKKYYIYNRDTLLGQTDSITFKVSMANTVIKRGSFNNFYVVAEDNSGNVSAPSNELPFANNGLGLFASYYEGAFSVLPNFATYNPLKTGLVRNATVRSSSPLLINTLTGTDFPSRNSNFALKLEGYIYVNTAAGYKFYTESDDGSKLWINGTQVVNNDYLQGMTERAGTYTFPAKGWYTITIGFFQGTGAYGLNTRYESTSGGLAKQIFSLNALSYLSNGTTTGVISTPGFNTTITGGNWYPNNQTDKPRIRIQWSLASFNGLRGFEIYRIATTTGTNKVAITSNWQKIATISNNTVSPNTYAYVDTTDTPGAFLNINTKYFYALKALTNTGNTNLIGYRGSLVNPTFLGIAIPSSVPGIPGTPTNLSTSGISNTIISLNWLDNATNESGFEVWRSYNKNGIYVKAGLVPMNVIAFYDSTCEANSKYVYKIRAFNAGGYSSYSAVDSTITLNIPTPPSNLKGMAVGPNAININWKNNSEYAFGYALYRSISRTTGYTLVDSIPNSNLTFYQDKTVADNMKYYYKVRAFNENVSAFSNIDSIKTFLSATPETDWKLPAVSVSGSFNTSLMNNAVNLNKLSNALISKNDFLNNLVITAMGISSLSIKLPDASEMPRGGFMTINFIKGAASSLNPKGDTLNNQVISNVPDTSGRLYLDYGILNSPYDFVIGVSVSGNNTDTTSWIPLPHNINSPNNNNSNLLQKINFPATISGRWVKIVIQSKKTSNANLFLSEIGMYRILPEGKRHNYFLLLGASIEQQSPSQGLKKFRQRLIANGIAGGNTAVVFNIFGSPGVGPGKNSIQLRDGIDDVLDEHPYAEFIMIHQGGNNINSVDNAMRPLRYEMFKTKPEVNSFIVSFVDIYSKILLRGKIPLISRMHFRDYRPGNSAVSSAGTNLYVNEGRNQENGSLPYNLLLDSLTKIYAPHVYNEAERRSSLNYYAISLNDQSILGGDGFHPTTPTQNPNPSIIVDRLVDYWVNYPMQSIYTGTTASPIVYNPGPKNICPGNTFAEPACWLSYAGSIPDNKKNLLDSAQIAVELAEKTTKGVDIWNAKILVEQIGDRTIRIPYVIRLENIRDYRTPAAPTELNVFVVSNSSLNLSWVKNSSNSSGFQVWRSNTNTGNNFKLAGVVTTAGSMSFLDTGLSGDTVYTYYVKAVNSGFGSAWSNFVSARPSSTYYSKEIGELTSIGTWGLNLDGTGGNPINFTSSGQTFVITNRGYVSELSNGLTVSGYNSKLILSSNTQLSIEPLGNLNAVIDVMDNAKLYIKCPINPTLGNVDTTSTIGFGNANIIPTKDYGNINLIGTGTRYLPTGNLNVYRNISLEEGIQLRGTNATSTISLYNSNLVLADATASLSNVSINLVRNNALFDAKSGTVALNNLTIGGNSLDLINSSNLLVGANAGQTLQINEGAKLLLNNSNLSIVGAATLNAGPSLPGQINVNGGSIYFSTSSPQNHQLLFDDNDNKVYNLGINLSAGIGDTVKIFSPIFMYNTVKLASGVLNTNNYLTLVSNSANTARIAKVETNARLAGQITAQRYVGPFKKSSYYMLGTPIWNNPISTWQSFISLQGFVSSGTGASVKSSTINNWSESQNSWMANSDSTALLVPGIGYRSFIKTKDLAYEDSAGFYSNTGMPVVGNGYGNNNGQFTIPITKTTSSRGWNVIANPYPSEIDWEATSGWDKTNINNAYYVWDGARRVYRSYLSSGGTDIPSISSNGMTSIINSGQGFLVYSFTLGNSTLSMTEEVKTEISSLPNFYRSETNENVFRIFLNNNQGESDEAIIRFIDNSTENFDLNIDALKLEGESINISLLTPKSESLVINSIPNQKISKIPLIVKPNIKGEYYFNFKGIENLKSTDIFLVDNFLNKTHQLHSEEKNYFSVSNDSLSFGNKRFELRFENGSFPNDNKSLIVFQNYPNPFYSHSSFKFSLSYEDNVEIVVSNSIGNIVYKHSQKYASGINYWQLDVEDEIFKKLSAGIYLYSITACRNKETRRFSLIK